MFKRWRKRSDPEPPVLPEYVLDAIGRSYLMVRSTGGDGEENGGNQIVLNSPVNPFVYSSDARLESILNRLYPELTQTQIEYGGRRWARHLATSEEPVNSIEEYLSRETKHTSWVFPDGKP